MMCSRPCLWLCRWLAARAHSAKNVQLAVEGWDEADLRSVIDVLAQLDVVLELYLMAEAGQAACCNAALAASSLKCLYNHGTQACLFPPSLVQLGLRQFLGVQSGLHCLTWPIAYMLGKLQPLPKLEILLITSIGWSLAEQDVQHLADCLPHLEVLPVEFLLSQVARVDSGL